MPIKDLFIVFQFIVVTHYHHIMSCAIFQYKLCLTVHKVLNNIAPVYLNGLFHIYIFHLMTVLGLHWTN